MGSSRPTRIYQHIHWLVCSPDTPQGQWASRYIIHASRLLSDEVLRSIMLHLFSIVVVGLHFCKPLHVAMKFGLYLRFRVQRIVSEGAQVSFPADCLHQSIFTFR